MGSPSEGQWHRRRSRTTRSPCLSIDHLSAVACTAQCATCNLSSIIRLEGSIGSCINVLRRWRHTGKTPDDLALGDACRFARAYTARARQILGYVLGFVAERAVRAGGTGPLAEHRRCVCARSTYVLAQRITVPTRDRLTSGFHSRGNCCAFAVAARSMILSSCTSL